MKTVVKADVKKHKPLLYKEGAYTYLRLYIYISIYLINGIVKKVYL